MAAYQTDWLDIVIAFKMYFTPSANTKTLLFARLQCNEDSKS